MTRSEANRSLAMLADRRWPEGSSATFGAESHARGFAVFVRVEAPGREAFVWRRYSPLSRADVKGLVAKAREMSGCDDGEDPGAAWRAAAVGRVRALSASADPDAVRAAEWLVTGLESEGVGSPPGAGTGRAGSVQMAWCWCGRELEVEVTSSCVHVATFDHAAKAAVACESREYAYRPGGLGGALAAVRTAVDWLYGRDSRVFLPDVLGGEPYKGVVRGER